MAGWHVVLELVTPEPRDAFGGASFASPRVWGATRGTQRGGEGLVMAATLRRHEQVRCLEAVVETVDGSAVVARAPLTWTGPFPQLARVEFPIAQLSNGAGEVVRLRTLPESMQAVYLRPVPVEVHMSSSTGTGREEVESVVSTTSEAPALKRRVEKEETGGNVAPEKGLVARLWSWGTGGTGGGTGESLPSLPKHEKSNLELSQGTGTPAGTPVPLAPATTAPATPLPPAPAHAPPRSPPNRTPVTKHQPIVTVAGGVPPATFVPLLRPDHSFRSESNSLRRVLVGPASAAFASDARVLVLRSGGKLVPQLE